MFDKSGGMVYNCKVEKIEHMIAHNMKNFQ